MNAPTSRQEIMVPVIMELPPNYTEYGQYNVNTADAIHVPSFFTVDDASTIVLICIYIPVFLVAFIGNALLLAIVVPHRASWGVTSSFLVNLALADILVAVVCIPMTLANKVYVLWLYGEVMCKATTFLQGVSVTASTFTLAAMSMDRCLAIRHPMKCRSIRTSGHVRTLLIFIWIFSAILISPLLFFTKTESHELYELHISLTYCIESWPNDQTRQIYDVVLLIVFFAIPGTLVTVSYSLMGRRLWTPDKTLEHSRRQNSHYIKTRPTDSIMAGRRNLARMLIVMASLFAVCWLPYFIIVTYIDFADQKGPPLTLLSFSLALGHFNSAVNPILYSFMNKTFRKYMKRLLSCQRKKRQSTTNEKGFLLAQMSWKTKSVKSTFISSFRGNPRESCTSPNMRRGSPKKGETQQRCAYYYGATANESTHKQNSNRLNVNFKAAWAKHKHKQNKKTDTEEVFINYDMGLSIPTTIGEETSVSLKTSPSLSWDPLLQSKEESVTITTNKCDLQEISETFSDSNHCVKPNDLKDVQTKNFSRQKVQSQENGVCFTNHFNSVSSVNVQCDSKSSEDKFDVLGGSYTKNQPDVNDSCELAGCERHGLRWIRPLFRFQTNCSLQHSWTWSGCDFYVNLPDLPRTSASCDHDANDTQCYLSARTQDRDSPRDEVECDLKKTRTVCEYPCGCDMQKKFVICRLCERSNAVLQNPGLGNEKPKMSISGLKHISESFHFYQDSAGCDLPKGVNMLDVTVISNPCVESPDGAKSIQNYRADS